MSDFSTVTVLVNPAAGSGSGARVCSLVEQRIPQNFATSKVDFINTQSRDHLIEIARTCNSDLVICVGGDGSIHDFVQPLMERPQNQRPCISIIPVGSGNDYARTLGISLQPKEALQQLAQGRVVQADIGKVNDSYFLETLSFGVDAAVALNTEELRLSTKTTGLTLYARAAVSAIIRELKSHRFEYVIDDQKGTEDLVIMAIQNGPTYGSGFKVAPHASITDGQLDIYTASNLNTVQGLYYLLQMKDGKHQKLKKFKYYKAGKISLRLDYQIPAQCDGERLLGTSFDIEVISGALSVYVPNSSPVLN